MKKLKWTTDWRGDIFDIRDGNATFIIHKDMDSKKITLRGKYYSNRFEFTRKSIASAKRTAQLIYEG